MRTIAYLLAGLLISLGLGLTGAAHLSPLGDHALLREGCDLALIVSVFGSGLAVERRIERSSWLLIGLLLVVVMPATIALIALYGAGAMGLPLAAAVLLGAVLAPTDPVLAGDVGLGPPGEDVFGEPRLSLHTEAGANDGLAAPFVAAGLLLAREGGAGWIGHWLAVDVVVHVAVALALGVLLGRLAVMAITRLDGRRLPTGTLGVLDLVVPFAVYLACEALHGDGLVGVFAAGFTFRRGESAEYVHVRVHGSTERVGRVLELVVIVGLGSMLSSAGLAEPGLAGWLLALVVIFVIRPLLVLVVCLGGPLNVGKRLFLGFFGVRGVAAVYYAAALAGARVLPARETSVIVWTSLVCVAVSIVVHGCGALPLTRGWLADP